MKQPEQTGVETLKTEMVHKQRAYRDIKAGTGSLLATNSLFWTERLLLKLANWVARQRLAQLAVVLADEA